MNEQDKLFLDIINLPDTNEAEHIDKIIKLYEYVTKCEGYDIINYHEDVDEVKNYSMDILQSIAKSKGYIYCSGKKIKPRKLRDKTSNILYKIQD